MYERHVSEWVGDGVNANIWWTFENILVEYGYIRKCFRVDFFLTFSDIKWISNESSENQNSHSKVIFSHKFKGNILESGILL